MSENLKEKLTRIIISQANYKKRKVFSDYINFKKDGKTIRMVLNPRACGYGQKYENMQNNMSCFEGWAIVIRLYCKNMEDWNGNIILDVDVEMLPDFSLGKGHYGRFLYRVLRFSEQYEWFSIDAKISAVLRDFKEKYLNKNSINNIGHAEAGANEHSEIRYEKFFSNNEAYLTEIIKSRYEDYIGPSYRQLACGLFPVNKISTKSQIFTGGKSAMDLWNISFIDNKKIMNLIELKTENKMVGIISEIFFYVNYCRDVFTKEAIFTINNNYSDESRGYENLVSQDVDCVNAIMLTDIMHPLLDNSNLVWELNNNNQGIKYYDCRYSLDILK